MQLTLSEEGKELFSESFKIYYFSSCNLRSFSLVKNNLSGSDRSVEFSPIPYL